MGSIVYVNLCDVRPPCGLNEEMRGVMHQSDCAHLSPINTRVDTTLRIGGIWILKLKFSMCGTDGCTGLVPRVSSISISTRLKKSHRCREGENVSTHRRWDANASHFQERPHSSVLKISPLSSASASGSRRKRARCPQVCRAWQRRPQLQ